MEKTETIHSEIHPAYLWCLEEELWYLIVMYPDTGKWRVAQCYDSASEALEHTADADPYEVYCFVPRHVANTMRAMG